MRWIEGFITNRRQRVIINGCTSGWADVASGVPQGSISGPLLFLIYINDISEGLSTDCKLFADDCTLFGEVNSRRDALAIQKDLDLV